MGMDLRIFMVRKAHSVDRDLLLCDIFKSIIEVFDLALMRGMEDSSEKMLEFISNQMVLNEIR